MGLVAPSQCRVCVCLRGPFSHVPADWETKSPFGMTTLSSEFLAQSTMPLRPFMGKLMSVITDTAGSLWMLATAQVNTQQQETHTDAYYFRKDQCFPPFFLKKKYIFSL